MATTTMKFPYCPLIAKLPSRDCVLSEAVVVKFAECFHKTDCASGRKYYSECSFVHAAEPYLSNNFKRMAWQIRSNVDGSGLDPSASSGNGSGTRLIRAIQALRMRLNTRIQEIRKNLPMKLLFFLVGFYCATAFATVIGQTGDWDILSAALAVVVVEGIGALMYKASFPLLNNIRGLITMFNYWKAGVSLGLFLDSFKYEIDNFMTFSNPFSYEVDVFSLFL